MALSDAATAQLNSNLNDEATDLQQQLEAVKHQLKLAQQRNRSLAEIRDQQDTRIRLLEDDIRRRSARVASLEVDKEELSARIRVLEDESRQLGELPFRPGLAISPGKRLIIKRTANVTAEL
jgi:uncharacterized protein YigA (DUF484 family)